MSRNFLPGGAVRAFALVVFTSLTALAQPSVTTYHNDLGRTGLNGNETILTPQNVNSGSFGKLFSLPIDGPSNSQVLYVPKVNIAGKGIHNVVFIVNEHDSVYAFDADSNVGANATPLWRASMLDPAHGAAPGAIPEPVSDLGNCGDIAPEVGVVGTPVIDPVAGTIYLVAKTNEGGLPVQRLHALDITTGNERNNSPVVIQATVNGTGTGSSGGTLSFDPKWSIQRTGLLLANGYVYIGWGSHCDFSTWHGWIMSYDATSLQRVSAIASTPNGTGGGIWQSGAAFAADTVNGVTRVFASTGNGTYDGNGDYANDIVRIESPSGVMRVADHFTPFNQAALGATDSDVSSGGVMFLPDQTTGGHTRLMALAGKEGRIYLVDRDNMGGYNAVANNIVQDLPNTLAGLWATPSYWNNTLYFWGCNNQESTTPEVLKAFSFSGGLLSTTPSSVSSRSSLFPGSVLSISANGQSNGIVWAALSDRYQTNGNGTLLAFDATNVGRLLWSSDQNPGRDGMGPAVKYVVPTIANGKVYAGNLTSINVYGLLPTNALPPVFSPPPGTYSGSVNVTLSSTQGGLIYYTLDGSTPTTASTPYTAPFNLTAPTVVNAIAVVPGLGTSAVASGAYSITTSGGGGINISNFKGAPLVLSGSAIADTQLTLTQSQPYQLGAAYSSVKLPVQSFTTSFNFQLQSPAADGLMFVIQNNSPTTTGYGGGGLGFSGMDNSVGIKFDLYNNGGEGPSSTGLYSDGQSPVVPAVDTRPSGIDLHSGDPMNAAITYDGKTLTMVLMDLVTSKKLTLTSAVNIPSAVRGNSAYVGFTASSGSAGMTAVITSWSYTPGTGGTQTADFGLTAVPSAVALQAPGSATSQINVAALNGFNGAVSFSASGLPAGLTASFSPASSTSASTLTLTGAGTSSWSGTVTVTGTSGSLTHSTVVAVTLTGPGGSGGGYANGYTHRRTVVINHANVPNTDQSNFPFWFTVTDPLFRTVANGGHVNSVRGYDIVFSTDPQGTSGYLKHEIGGYDGAAGKFSAFVNLPSLSHIADTTVYVFYGNPGVTTSQENATQVWDGNFVGVWHLSRVSDSTANGLTGSAGSGTTAGSGAVVGNGMAFDGSGNAYVDFGSASQFDITGAFTISTWYRKNGLSGSYEVFASKCSASACNYELALDAFNFDLEGVQDGNVVESGSAPSLNQWHQVVEVSDGSKLSFYLDGALVSAVPAGTGATIPGTHFDIGREQISGENFSGLLDEVRLSKIVRSADWIATEYRNQANPAGFFSVSAEQ